MNILPCPFCGGNGITVHEKGSFWTGTRYIPTSYEILHWCPNVPGDIQNIPIRMISRTEEGAIVKWNRRAP